MKGIFRRIKDQGIQLAPGPKELMNMQRFYLYLNMTKPRELLCLSFCQSDSQGKALSPAFLVSNIREMFPEMEIRQCGEAIYAGNIAVNPYRSDIETSCTYCPYASVCGMDAKIPGYEYRQFASMKKEEVLDQMQTELARNRGKEERSDEMDEGTAERH